MVQLNGTTRSKQALNNQERLFYLDWLKVITVLGVFYAHTIDIFDIFYLHLKNSEGSFGVAVLFAFISQWGMALFFLLSGASAWFALRSRSSDQFIRERIKRLVIPLIIGFIILSPIQGYFEFLNKARLRVSFLQFYPQFFEHIQIGWDPQWLGTYGYHLWFLAFLFVFSLLALPLFVYLRREPGHRFLTRLASVCVKPGGMFVFILPLALIQATLRARFPIYQDWADFFYWFAFFVYGYILFSDRKFEHAMQNARGIALLTAIICCLTIVALAYTGIVNIWEKDPTYSFGYIFYQILRCVAGWSLMIFVLHFGEQFLNVNNKILQYGSKAILPFYLLHQPVIVVFAFYFGRLDLPLLLKFLIISTCALITTLALYDLLIKRVRPVRVLFGLK